MSEGVLILKDTAAPSGTADLSGRAKPAHNDTPADVPLKVRTNP